MQTINEALQKAFNESVYKLVLSNPVSGAAQFKRISIVKKQNFYQVEKYTEQQVFHENLDFEGARALAESLLGTAFKQVNAWDDATEYSIKLSKKGKVLYNEKPSAQAPQKQLSHNRKKKYILPEGEIIRPLVDMGVINEFGQVVNSMYDKFRQINHFVEIIDDGISKLGQQEITVIDFGCGKSYLTFVLYYYITEIKQMSARIVGLDLKADVIEHCNATAEKYGYTGLSFELGDINGYVCKFAPDMVIALHACDTATDYALNNAVNWGAKLIYSVPCCQHELNSQITPDKLSIITRYGLIKERAAALFTDAIRANMLVYSGYDTQILEFINMEHTPKNILIRARKGGVSQAARDKALEEVEQMMQEFSLEPALFRLLVE